MPIFTPRMAGPSLARSADVSGMSAGVLSLLYAANTASGSIAVGLSSDAGATYTPAGGVLTNGSGSVRPDSGGYLVI